MSYPQGLELLQYAREAVKGTDLAATSALVVETIDFHPSSPDMNRPREARGLMLANRGNESIIQHATEFALEGPMTYEQAHVLANMVIANVATPTGVGPYVWTHTRNPAGMPSLATMTFERRETDGSTPIDHGWHYAMGTMLEVSFAADDLWKYKLDGFARKVQSESITGAITVPTHEEIITPGTKLYIDSTFGALGGSQVVGQLLSGNIKFGSGAMPRWVAEGRTDLDFTSEDYDDTKITCECSLTVLLGAQYATEKAAAEAGTLRAIRLEQNSGTKQVRIDALLKYKTPDLFNFGLDNGQRIVVLDLVGSTDFTNAWSMKVTNNVATFI